MNYWVLSLNLNTIQPVFGKLLIWTITINYKKCIFENDFICLDCLIWFQQMMYEIFFLFFPENRSCHFMQIVSIGNNLHEMSNPAFWEK